MSVITLRQGDDSNALGRETKITIETDLDLTGFTAVFQLGEFQQKFDDITNHELFVVIPRDASANLPVGELDGALKIYDANGLALTVADEIKFLIEEKVVENVK